MTAVTKTHRPVMIRGVFLTLTLALLALLFVTPAHAQTAGVKIQPSIIEERIQASQVTSGTLTVTNLGTESQTFFFDKRDISGVDSKGSPQFTTPSDQKSGYEASSWLTLSADSVTIAPGERASITYTVSVPKDVLPGSHFAAIVATSKPPEIAGQNQTSVSFGAATIFSLRSGSAGAAVETASIRAFSTDKTLYGRADVNFTIRMQNGGNTVLRPRGPLEITDMFGKKVASFTVNPETAGIFPKSIRNFTANWKGEGLYFGRYQVVVSLAYGEDQIQTVSDTLSFWIVPLNIVLPLLGGILVAIVLILLLVRRHVGKRIREIQGATERVRGGSVASLSRRRKDSTLSRTAVATITVLLVTLLFFLIVFFFLA